MKTINVTQNLYFTFQEFREFIIPITCFKRRSFIIRQLVSNSDNMVHYADLECMYRRQSSLSHDLFLRVMNFLTVMCASQKQNLMLRLCKCPPPPKKKYNEQDKRHGGGERVFSIRLDEVHALVYHLGPQYFCLNSGLNLKLENPKIPHKLSGPSMISITSIIFCYLS